MVIYLFYTCLYLHNASVISRVIADCAPLGAENNHYESSVPATSPSRIPNICYYLAKQLTTVTIDAYPIQAQS